jgi:hypothetical protein
LSQRLHQDSIYSSQSDIKIENRKISDDITLRTNEKIDLTKEDIKNNADKNSDVVFSKLNEKIDLAKEYIKNNENKNADDIINKLNEKINNKSKRLTILVYILIAISIVGLVVQFVK